MSGSSLRVCLFVSMVSLTAPVLAQEIDAAEEAAILKLVDAATAESDPAKKTALMDEAVKLWVESGGEAAPMTYSDPFAHATPSGSSMLDQFEKVDDAIEGKDLRTSTTTDGKKRAHKFSNAGGPGLLELLAGFPAWIAESLSGLFGSWFDSNGGDADAIVTAGDRKETSDHYLNELEKQANADSGAETLSDGSLLDAPDYTDGYADSSGSPKELTEEELLQIMMDSGYLSDPVGTSDSYSDSSDGSYSDSGDDSYAGSSDSSYGDTTVLPGADMDGGSTTVTTNPGDDATALDDAMHYPLDKFDDRPEYINEDGTLNPEKLKEVLSKIAKDGREPGSIDGTPLEGGESPEDEDDYAMDDLANARGGFGGVQGSDGPGLDGLTGSDSPDSQGPTDPDRWGGDPEGETADSEGDGSGDDADDPDAEGEEGLEKAESGLVEREGKEKADAEATDPNAPQPKTLVGRVILLPKLEDHVEQAPRHTVRFDDAEPGELLEPTMSQDEVIDQIIRVEMVVVEWRRTKRSAYTSGREADPLAAVRDEDGKIDFEKVDMWIVAEETWLEEQKPLRYRIQEPESIENLEVEHGETIVLAGHLHEIKVLEPQVIAEIGGDVQELEVVKVLPNRVTDEEVGGLGLELDPDGKPWNQPLGVGGDTLGR